MLKFYTTSYIACCEAYSNAPAIVPWNKKSRGNRGKRENTGDRGNWENTKRRENTRNIGSRGTEDTVEKIICPN